MKNLYSLLVSLFISFTLNAQIIDIPDANFKNALISIGVDTDNDGEISISEAEARTFLEINGLSISSLEGIEYFVNLEYLSCMNNVLTNLDLTNNTSIDVLYCNDNQLITLDVSTSSYVSEFDCSNNPNLTSLELGSTFDYLTLNNTGLTEIDLGEKSINYLNLRSNLNLTYARLGSYPYSSYNSHYVTDNALLEFISFKNGNSNYDNLNSTYNICNNSSLTYVCADEFEIDSWSYTDGPDEVTVYGIQDMVSNCGYSNVVVGSYCSFTPGGVFYTVEGNTFFDADSNGCDVNDSIYPNLNFEISSGSETGNFISNSSGIYSIPIDNGDYIFTPILENLNYYSVSPSSLTVDFPTDASPFTQDFCITPNGVFNDLEITIIPLEEARPGFDADYKIVYKNKGTTTLSGDIDFGFQDTLMDYVTATPPNESGLSDLLSWSFIDLTPFESREIYLTMNINSPMETPPVNGDDVLSFTTTISSPDTDETPNDNTFQLNQTVVNSFDPNDKTCLEGDTIGPEMVGEFVHYRIRFENTGTANAINVVVKDNIDRASYDLSSLVALDASHEFVARIKDDASDYYVEFIFEDINLPFDDANNDGYVVFKIRTLDTLQLNDIFENEAEIYFDFNFPIITNLAQTTVATLSTEDFNLANTGIVLYPNPTRDILHLEAKQAIQQISIYDISGRQIQDIAVIGSKTRIELSTEALSAGTYFVKIKSSSSELVKKFIKE